MSGITLHTGKVAALDIANIDTDAIIPKQFLQKISREGFGLHLFHDWRFLDESGQIPNPAFALNQPQNHGASILLTRENFGCGSSREHAPWALADYGFRVIVASSFADIFYNNAINNHILPICLSSDQIDTLFLWQAKHWQQTGQSATLTIDLPAQQVRFAEQSFLFDIAPDHKTLLVEGLDNIGLTMQLDKQIRQYEEAIPTFYQ